MKKPRVISRTEDIAECGERWFNRTTGRYHRTAYGAFKAVSRRSKQLMDENTICVATINWHTSTPTGSRIVKAINAAVS
jgi:hypothetical protein